MSQNEAALDIRGLSKAYGGHWAVRDLSLTVPPGSIFGFLGPNGAGKTTTLKMLLGLVRPTSGEARVLGMDVRTQGVEIRRAVGYLPESQSLYGNMTARQLLAFNAAFYPTWDRELVGRHLDGFNLALDKRVSEFSRGMRSQLGLILAIGSRPRVLFLDEPTAGLDPLAVRRFLGVILEEAADSGQTVFMSSHLLHQVERVADWVGIINQGRLLVSRPAEDLKVNVKRIRVAFQVEPPASLWELPGVSEVKADGRRYLVSVTDRFDEVLAAISAVPHFALEVVDQNLEDIFLRYAGEGGSRAE
jgi:ABC-2 type transport system ATP-binding protein